MKKKITFLLIIMSVLILTVLIFRIKSPSGISVEDAQKQMENSLEANGISEKGYLTDTCLTAQDKYKAYLDYFRIAYEI